MKLCINEASTMTTDFATDVRAYAAAGFTGIELWLAKVDTYVEQAALAEAKALAQARALLDDHGLQAAAACAQSNLLLSQGQLRADTLDAFRRKLETCRVLGAPVIIVASESPKQVESSDYALAASNLAEANEIASQYGVKIALEFIKGCPLVGSVSTAMMLINQVNHPNLGLLFDTFHFFAGVTKVADMDEISHGKVAFVHINDCLDLPREILTDAHRTYLGEGTIPTKSLVSRLQGRGYDGWLSFEIFSRAVWAEDPFAVAVNIKRNLEEQLS